MISQTFSHNRTLSKLLLLASTLVLLWPTPGLAQESQIFRLVTFVSAGDSRLGATHGEGQADIVDVHHAIQYLMREQPSTVWRPSLYTRRHENPD